MKTKTYWWWVMTIDPQNIFVRYDYIIRFSGLEDCHIILILISLLLYLCLWSYCGSKCFPRLLERKIMYMTKRYWPTIWMKEHVLLKCLLAYRLSYNLYLVVIFLYSKVAVIIKRFWSFTEKSKYLRYIYWEKNHRVGLLAEKKNLLQVKFKHLKILEYWCWNFSNTLRCSYQYLDSNLVENQENFRKHMNH